MLKDMETSSYSSIYVPPLNISKSALGSRNVSPSYCQPSSGNLHPKHVSFVHQAQMTPPLTPVRSQEDLGPHTQAPPPVFHNYLRSFYPYHPNCDEGSSTVTLPLNHGDVVLVHSVHTNGWADGTLLTSGARGWLPTNYCEAYDHEPIRTLLKALTNFCDLVRGSSSGNLEAFTNIDYIHALVAGVRILLVSHSVAESFDKRCEPVCRWLAKG